MSQPVAGRSAQGTRRSPSNQQSDTNSRSTVHATISPPQRDLTDLMRYAMGYPTIHSAENMGLPPNMGDLTGSTMAPPPRTIAPSRVIQGSRSQSIMPLRTEPTYSRYATTTSSNNPTTAATSQIQTPTSTTRSITRPSSSTAPTSRSENSLISSPPGSTRLGPENTDGSKMGEAKASKARSSKPILPWR